MEARTAALGSFATRTRGVPSRVDPALLPAASTVEPDELHLGRAFDRGVDDGASLVFVRPASVCSSWRGTIAVVAATRPEPRSDIAPGRWPDPTSSTTPLRAEGRRA